MRKILTAAVVIASTALTGCSVVMAGAGSLVSQALGDEYDTADSLVGTWKQNNSRADDAWMEASIKDDVITIEWVEDNGTDRSIYWIGPFDSETGASGDTVTSPIDVAGTDAEFMASSESTKDFVIEDGVLKFDVVEDDVNFAATMDKISDTPTTIKRIQNTDSTRVFKDNKLEVPRLTIDITDYHVVPAKNSGTGLGQKPLIVFDFDITNKTDEPMSPADFILFFDAVQNTPDDADPSLDIGFDEDSESPDIGFDEMSRGETQHSSIAFELNNEKSPVQLVATEEFDLNEIGRQEFDIQKDSQEKKVSA